MSRVGPFDTFPQLVERKAGLVDMMLRDQVGVTDYRFWAAKTLNDAYGNPNGVTGPSGVGGAGSTQIFSVAQTRQFRSPSLIRRQWGWYGETLKGMTRVAWNPEDYVPLGTPSDSEMQFIRVQQRRQAFGDYLEVQGAVNTGDPKMGPIYCVPVPQFFGTSRPILVVQGLAPANTGCAAGAAPMLHMDIQDPNPMHIILPRTTHSITISNLDVAETLLLATDLYSPMSAVGPDDDPAIAFGAVKEIVVAAGGANAVSFSIYAVVALDGGP